MQYNTHTLQWCRPSSVTAGDYYYYFYYSFPHYARASYTHPGTHADTNTRVRAPAARDRFSSGFSSSFNFFFSFLFDRVLFSLLFCAPVRLSPTRPRRGGRPPTTDARAVRGLRTVRPADRPPVTGTRNLSTWILSSI